MPRAKLIKIDKATPVWLDASQPGEFCDKLHALTKRVSKFQMDHPEYSFKYISLEAQSDGYDILHVVLRYTYERPATELEQRKEELKQKERDRADVERLHELAKKYNWPIPENALDPVDSVDPPQNVLSESELRIEINRKIIEDTNRILAESSEVEEDIL